MSRTGKWRAFEAKKRRPGRLTTVTQDLGLRAGHQPLPCPTFATHDSQAELLGTFQVPIQRPRGRTEHKSPDRVVRSHNTPVAAPGRGSRGTLMPRELDVTWRMLDDFAEVARLAQVQGDHPDAFQALCALGMKVVGGDHASITTVDRGRFSSVTSTSDVPRLIDEIQADASEGPCLNAAQTTDCVRIDDLTLDTRWPRFGHLTSSRLGVHSLVAAVRPVSHNVVSAVNVYAARPHAFSPDHETVLSIFASTAAVSLRVLHQDNRAVHLERALHTSRRIGVALGILMNSKQINLEEAWTLLCKASQDNNIKLSVLADRVLRSGTVELPSDD